MDKKEHETLAVVNRGFCPGTFGTLYQKRSDESLESVGGAEIKLGISRTKYEERYQKVTPKVERRNGRFDSGFTRKNLCLCRHKDDTNLNVPKLE